jgi:hypothetical protein
MLALQSARRALQVQRVPQRAHPMHQLAFNAPLVLLRPLHRQHVARVQSVLMQIPSSYRALSESRRRQIAKTGHSHYLERQPGHAAHVLPALDPMLAHPFYVRHAPQGHFAQATRPPFLAPRVTTLQLRLA